MAYSLARVLYVEDQKTVAGLIQLELEQANLHVTTVPNGEEGLALARKQRFDLILLDQMLPDMNGLEICRRLKSDPALQDIPVMFFTAFPGLAEEREANRLGAVDFLKKGIHSARLAARILAEVELARDRAKHSSPKPPQKLNEGTQSPPSMG